MGRVLECPAAHPYKKIVKLPPHPPRASKFKKIMVVCPFPTYPGKNAPTKIILMQYLRNILFFKIVSMYLLK